MPYYQYWAKSRIFPKLHQNELNQHNLSGPDPVFGADRQWGQNGPRQRKGHRKHLKRNLAHQYLSPYSENGEYSKDHWNIIIPYIKQLQINELIFCNPSLIQTTTLSHSLSRKSPPSTSPNSNGSFSVNPSMIKEKTAFITLKPSPGSLSPNSKNSFSVLSLLC